MSTPTMSPATGSTVRIGRLPVHDRDLQVVAYELQTDGPAVQDADEAEARANLFMTGMIDVGLERLASGKDVVVSLPDALVREGALAHLPVARMILQVTAEHAADAEMEALLRTARDEGLRLLVTDPVAHPHLAGIADVADWVSVDVTHISPPERRRRASLLRQPGRQLLATGVDDHLTHRDCHAAGFDLFSGVVLSTPNVVSGTRLGSDRLALLRLVALLDDPDAGVDDLEAAVSSNPALSYQVLRYVNSAYVGLRTSVDSIRRAVVLVGPPVLRQLAGLLLAGDDSGKPLESTRIALARAETCAAVGAALGDGRPAYHTVGLLSAIDLLVDVPLQVAIEGLPLTEEVMAALLDHEGRLGSVLQAVRLYEHCEWDDPRLQAFDAGVLSEAWLVGLSRADEILAKIDGNGG